MFLRWVDRAVEFVAVVALTASVGMICINVINRHVILGWLRKASETWEALVPMFQTLDAWFGAVSVTADEVPGYLLVWIGFLGAYLALRRDGHISFDMLVSRLSEDARRRLQIVTDLMIAAFLAMLVWTSIKMIVIDGSTEIETAEIGQGWFMLILPIAGVLMGGVVLYRLYQGVLDARSQPDITPRPGD